jgi:hypothetical protein
LRRKYEEGEADVILGRLHPELRPVLLMAKILENHRLTMRVIGFFAFRMPGQGTLLMRLSQLGLPILEWFRLRLFWRYLLDLLMAYWYWRGVAQEIQSVNEVKTFLAETAPPQANLDIELDLAEGLGAAERMLDQVRPDSATFRYGPHLVGWLPPQPGVERLCGAHLRRILALDLLNALYRALLLAGGEAISGSN